MAKIIISTNATLDGVVQDPDGKEGTAFGGWFGQHVGTDFDAWSEREIDEAMHADALLLGRRSDAWFATRMPTAWSAEWAARITSLPKYVVSSTLERAELSNATVLGGDVVREVSELKRRLDGDILVYGSCQLSHTLVAQGLADELRVVVFPVVLGTGKRLFGGSGNAKPVRLISTGQLGNGLVLHSYAFLAAA
ncbi:dihydrofolate reductase family protein [Rhodanobacter aciditrophus]|uniref:dihydrofolate reductase family protein n=1 Tax=Rhodanobacter aciditrophus TaxID=1623218 RepID=UPI003CF7E55A